MLFEFVIETDIYNKIKENKALYNDLDLIDGYYKKKYGGLYHFVPNDVYDRSLRNIIKYYIMYVRGEVLDPESGFPVKTHIINNALVYYYLVKMSSNLHETFESKLLPNRELLNLISIQYSVDSNISLEYIHKFIMNLINTYYKTSIIDPEKINKNPDNTENEILFEYIPFGFWGDVFWGYVESGGDLEIFRKYCEIRKERRKKYKEFFGSVDYDTALNQLLKVTTFTDKLLYATDLSFHEAITPNELLTDINFEIKNKAGFKKVISEALRRKIMLKGTNKIIKYLLLSAN